MLTRETRRALAFGRLSAEDAAVFCALAEEAIGAMHPIEHYFAHPEPLPRGDTARWFVLNCIRQHVKDGKLAGLKPRAVNRFLTQPPHEHQLTLLTDLVDRWGALGADAAMLGSAQAGDAAVSPPGDRRARCSSGIERGLRMVTVPFPHLAGLAAADARDARRAAADDGRVRVGPSGRQPGVRARLKDNELVFVLAHELLHLALRTHDRARGADRLEFNYAHDYIINDILRAELGQADPRRRPRHAGRPRAVGRGDRPRDAPQRRRRRRRRACGRARRPRPAGVRAGRPATEAGDVLDGAREAELYPRGGGRGQQASAEQVKALAAKALSLARAMGLANGAARHRCRRRRARRSLALRGLYRTPWELALQRWIESVAPGDRTFSPPVAPRRGAQPTSSCRDAGAKAGSSTSCSTRAAR